MTTLTDLVHGLANPRTLDGCIVESRLRTLRLGIRSSVGRGAGGGGQASARSLMNSSAFDLHADIADDINREVVRLHLMNEHRFLEERLRVWLPAFLATGPSAGEEGVWVEALARWTGQIDEIFDPPTTKLIDAACPVCGQTRGRTKDASFHALVITFHEGEDDMTLMCRACKEVIASGAGAIKYVAPRLGIA